MNRTDDEKTSLTLYRYKNWVATVTSDVQKLQALQEQMNAVVDHLSYSLLEAREEQEKLIAGGMTKDEIESVAVIPQIPVDPLMILKRIKSRTSTIQDVLNKKQD
jgi:hypothetical protein